MAAIHFFQGHGEAGEAVRGSRIRQDSGRPDSDQAGYAKKQARDLRASRACGASKKIEVAAPSARRVPNASPTQPLPRTVLWPKPQQQKTIPNYGFVQLLSILSSQNILPKVTFVPTVRVMAVARNVPLASHAAPAEADMSEDPAFF